MRNTIRVGTRQSPLALWQAEYVSRALREHGFDVELVRITTAGDTHVGALSHSGGVGLFTKEIQRALLDNRCDVAVHSLKDLPTEPIQGLALSAVPMREEPSDCLVSREKRRFADLPPGAVIGTGSPRRRAQLLYARRDLMIAEIRGNVDTRLRKLENGDYDAIVLAFAGLHRLELDDVISEKFPLDVMVPAVGQGALGLETRADDLDTIRAIRVLHHVPSFAATYCEREVLRQLKAGCLSPVAAHASCSDGRLHMRCVVFSQDHAIRISAEGSMAFDLDKPSDAAGPSRLSQQIVEDLVRQGAAELIGR